MILDTCKLVSLNVRGINNFRKRRAIYSWGRKQKADFIFLQETHSKQETERQWKNEWGGEIIMSHGSSNSRGVAILFKKGVDCIIHSKILDPVGRYVILKAEIKGKMYLLINIYAPNKDTNIVEFLRDLGTTLRIENLDEEENIILGGDFNCPLNPVLDKKGGIVLPRKSVVETIDCLCADFDLVDIWRVKNPLTKSYTWSQISLMIFCRLDYWLISNNLQDLVTITDIIPAIKTDHAAISIEFSISEKHIKGPGLWKMNCSLLDDEDYIREATAKIPIRLIEEPETLHHLLFYCSFVQLFWKDFEYFFYLMTREFVHLTLQDVIIGIIYANYPLLNYLLLVAKLYIWDCRRNLTPPIINAFKLKVKVKYETDKFMC